MRSGKWKVGCVVIKCPICTSRGMTGQTCWTVISIARHTIVLIIRFRIGMAGDTCKLSKITRRCMTINTITPLAIVCPAKNWKIEVIMIKRGRYP